MRKRLWIGVLVSWIITPLISSAQLQVDPEIDWKMLEEEHAVWVYDSRHKDLVLQYSRNFQRIFPHLKKMFQEIPDKTTFVITDYTDMPNGSATVFPYPLVNIFPVIPIPTSPIGETDDSLFEILAHEYTHILNLYPVHGAMRPFSWVFGSIVRPNGMLPRWYVEGLAVFTESYFTPHGGRLRSQNFEGLMRAMSQAKTFPNLKIDTLNDFHPDWLGGRRAYLLGGALMYELAVTHGVDKVYELNQRYSRRVPFLINGPLEDEIGRDYADLLGETYDHIQKKADVQLQVISSAPITQGQALPNQGNNSFRPRFSPDGKYLAYISGDQIMPTYVNLVERKENQPLSSAQPLRMAQGTGTEHIAWSNNSQMLAYNLIENHRRYYVYSDIYIYNVETKKADRITKGIRAGDMVFTADDKFLVFVQNTPGSKRISLLDLTTKETKVIYDPNHFGTNIFGLALKDQILYFVEQDTDQRELKALDISSGKILWSNTKVKPVNVRRTADGMLFTSAISGVDNLYFTKEFTATTDENTVKNITNSTSRVFDGDIDPQTQSLYYSEQKDNGIFVFESAKDEWAKINKAPRVPPLFTIPNPEKIPTEVEVAPGTEMPAVDTQNEREYSAWSYMLPRYWMPFAYSLDGGVGFQASTGVSDPLLKHNYSLIGEWDTLTKKTGASAAYINRQTPVEIAATASQVYRYIYATDNVLKDNSYSLSGSYNIPFIFRNWAVNMSWKHSETEFSRYTAERSGPGVAIGYGNAVQRGYQISPEKGGGFSLAHQSYIESLGNLGYNKTNLTLRQYYAPKWFPDRHVFFTQINGTYAEDLDDPNFFTSNIGGNFFSNLLIPPFLVRGYSSGTLLGKNMAAANFEYRFPLLYTYRGINTWPTFLKQVYGAVIFDTATLDGFRWNNDARNLLPGSEFGQRFYSGYGAEVNFDCTLGYYLPITFTFGVYRGLARDVAQDDISTFFAFRL